MAVLGYQQPLEHMLRCGKSEPVHERQSNVRRPKFAVNIRVWVLSTARASAHSSRDSMDTESG